MPRNPYELLDDDEDQVEVVGAVVARRGFKGAVTDEESAAVAADWLEERTGIAAKDITALIPDELVAEWLVENLGMNEEDATEAAQMMRVYEDNYGNRSRSEWPFPIPQHYFDILKDINDRVLGAYGVKTLYADDEGGVTTDWGVGANLAEYIVTGAASAPTVIYDLNNDNFFLLSWGWEEWAERRERRLTRMYIKLDNMEDREGTVMITTSGPGAGNMAARDQSVAGAHWEVLGEDFAHASPMDYPELLADLEADGYDVDASEYTPPEYETTGEAYYEGYDD